MNDKKCECDLCKLSMQIRTLEAKIPKELLQEYLNLINTLYNRMSDAETELAWTNAHIDASWPPSEDGKQYILINDKKHEVKGTLIDES